MSMSRPHTSNRGVEHVYQLGALKWQAGLHDSLLMLMIQHQCAVSA